MTKQTKRPNRPPGFYTDAEGNALVRVPLAAGHGYAILDEADYRALPAKGCSQRMYANPDGRGRVYVAAHHTGRGNVTQVARYIVGATARERVHYTDGDRLNLRGDNLRIVKEGGAKLDSVADPRGSARAITYRAPRDADIRSVAARIRTADRDAIAALSGRTPEDAMREAIAASLESYAASWGGQPHAIFGIVEAPEDDRFGIPWLIATGEAEANRRAITRDARKWLAAWSQEYTGLCNIVDARDKRAQAWLQRLGFRPLAPLDHCGTAGLPFIPFARFH